MSGSVKGGWVRLLSRPKKHMRLLCCGASGGVPGCGGPPDASWVGPDVTTIQRCFQSVWPAIRIRTQPSLRPRTSVDGAVRPVQRIKMMDVAHVKSRQTIIQGDADKMSSVNLLKACFLPSGES